MDEIRVGDKMIGKKYIVIKNLEKLWEGESGQ
jgi:hypothetical protein